jgi:WhiB family redox-sensing transcriptional regulator
MPLDGTALPEPVHSPAATGARASTNRRTEAPPQNIVGRELSEQDRLAAAIEVWDGALCTQVDPELFFPELGQPTREAKAICAACPVRVACLAVFGELLAFGVVGGQSAQDRRARRVAARRDGAAA